MPGDRLLLTGCGAGRLRAGGGRAGGLRQTDAAGAYDNVGYTLRGHQFTDEGGAISLRRCCLDSILAAPATSTSR
ncbi:MAG: hypothetical protein U0531_17905 [Dehalococcoidia bacterium]